MRGNGGRLSAAGHAREGPPDPAQRARRAARPDRGDRPAIRAGASRRAEEALLARGRVFLRYSGTEPLLRILVEGPDAAEVDAIAGELEAAVRAELA